MNFNYFFFSSQFRIFRQRWGRIQQNQEAKCPHTHTLSRPAARSIRRNTLRQRSTSLSFPKSALSDGRSVTPFIYIVLMPFPSLPNNDFFSSLPQTMSAKEKGKFEDMAKLDKARYEREMKNYIPPKGEKKKRFKDPNAPKRPP